MKRGSMLMEFVLTMPILVLLMFFVVQLTFLGLAHECTAYAAYCGARSLLSVNALETQSAAQNAAERALSWLHPQGLKSDKEPSWLVPGWGKVPGSDTIADHVSVEIDVAAMALTLTGQSSLTVVTVTYDCPLMIPVIGELMASFGKDGRTIKDGEPFPYLSIHETCALPLPYSTISHPIGGYL